MATNHPKAQSRVLKVSSVKVQHRNVTKLPCMVVDWSGFIGETRRLGAELLEAVALAQGLTTSRPTHVMFIDSSNHKGQVCAVPFDAPGEDRVEVEWFDKGRNARINLGTLFALKGIRIPEGTRMVIEVYRETDPDFDEVLGMKLQGAEFVPKQKGKPRKKKAEPAKAPEATAAATPAKQA